MPGTAAGVQLLAAIRAHVGDAAAPAARDVSNPATNPWQAGADFNLTEQGKIFRENPELAKTLEQAAQATKAA